MSTNGLERAVTNANPERVVTMEEFVNRVYCPAYRTVQTPVVPKKFVGHQSDPYLQALLPILNQTRANGHWAQRRGVNPSVEAVPCHNPIWL